MSQVIFNKKKTLKLSKSGIWIHPGKKLTDGEIVQIIWYLENGIEIAEISRITKRHRHTVEKYVSQFRSNQDLFFEKKKQAMSGNHTQVERLQFFEDLVQNAPGLTLQGMKTRYFLQFDESISRSMIFYILVKILNISNKRIVPIEWARTTQRVMFIHERFSQRIRKSKFIFQINLTNSKINV